VDNQRILLLPTDFKEKGPFAKVGKTLNAIGRLINGLHVVGGSVLTTKDFIRIRLDQQTTFSGTAYVSGAKTTGLNSDGTKGWIKCNAATGTASEVNAAEVVFPFPPNIEFYEKSKTYGDIHVTRL